MQIVLTCRARGQSGREEGSVSQLRVMVPTGWWGRATPR